MKEIRDINILAIESSCDETAAAVIHNGREVRSNVISSQIELHKLYGGVVPEIASRKHIEKINQVIEEALKEANVTLDDIDAIGVTYGPGLVGALLVGVAEAKAIAYAKNLPLVGVHHIEGHISANYIENPEFALKCMNKVIKAAIKNDLYIIIDWHTYYPQKEEAKAFFSMMAQKYGKYPHIIYEIYNEPMEDSWESVKEYATDIISEIRKYDPDNIILVGSPHWDQDLHLVAESPLKGFNNIMYTLHFYAATHKQELRDRAEAAWEKGIPIFVSECAGMECTGDGPLDIPEWTRWVEWLESKKISWVNWSISDKNETCSMILPRANKNGGWDESLIKPAGRQSRKFIRQYNSHIYKNKE